MNNDELGDFLALNTLSEKLSIDVVEDIRKKLQLIYNQKNQNFDIESILISN